MARRAAAVSEPPNGIAATSLVRPVEVNGTSGVIGAEVLH
jgi:hypothetical protein